MKEVIIVYQDCFMCGSHEKWGEKTIAEIEKAGVAYRKLSFACQEGQEHCEKAIAHGITSFPFVTDGERYAKTVDELFAKPRTATIKITKKTRKSKKD